MSVPGLTCVEDCLWLVTQPVGNPTYDFNFHEQFVCRHPWQLEKPITAVARLGAAPDYEARFHELREQGVTLIHSPGEYQKTSELPVWYPILEGLTPRSMVFEALPSVKAVESAFDYPIFIKGERQTSRHQRKLSIIESRLQLEDVLRYWHHDPILA